MDLSLKRTDYTVDGIFGELSDDAGKFLFYCLEHAYGSPRFTSDDSPEETTAAWSPKVPPGTYSCLRGTHQLEHDEPFETFEVMGVPGHTGILFHVGNFNRDSEGCILLGLERGRTMITGSKLAFGYFMEMQNGLDQFSLEVKA